MSRIIIQSAKLGNISETGRAVQGIDLQPIIYDLEQLANAVSGGGFGTVTSVGLTAPTSVFSVVGSPVTVAGTLAISLVNQSVNTFFAGPSSGPSATPTFRALTTSDLPAGTGTVVSVGLIADASLFTTTGSPVINTGTLAFSLINQNANLVFAGPVSGPAATPSFRALTSSDFPNSYWLLTGNTGTSSLTNFIGTTDPNPLVVKTNGVEVGRFTVGGSLNVTGISPNNGLFVYLTGSPATLIGSMAIDSTNGGYMNLFNDSGASILVSINSSAVGYDYVNTGYNFGIGTVSPTARLHVVGSGSTSATTTALFQNSSGNNSMWIGDNGYVGIGTNVPTVTLEVHDNATGGIQFIDDSRARSVFSTGTTGTTSGVAVGAQWGTGGYTATMNLVESTRYAGLYMESDPSDFAEINMNAGSGQGVITLYGSSFGGGYNSIFDISAPNGNNLLLAARGGGQIWFGDDLPITKQMVLDVPSGNFGINTTSPTARLHVVGSGSTSATTTALFQNSSSTTAMQIRDDSVILLPNLPTSSAGLPSGSLWNNAGSVSIV